MMAIQLFRLAPSLPPSRFRAFGIERIETMPHSIDAQLANWRHRAMIARKAKLAELKVRIAALDEERAAIAAEIVKLEQEPISEEMASASSVSDRCADADIVDQNSTIARKISLFRKLFRGRSDVFPIRWDNATSGKSG
jgi:hypothetical protein